MTAHEKAEIMFAAVATAANRWCQAGVLLVSFLLAAAAVVVLGGSILQWYRQLVAQRRWYR